MALAQLAEQNKNIPSGDRFTSPNITDYGLLCPWSLNSVAFHG